MRQKTDMGKLRTGWAIQVRVLQALMIRELTTRFGRENIGFLWIMGEPLLFASLVSLMWSVVKGPEENGLSVVAFVVSGYIPLTLFRHSVSRCIALFQANGSLMYHRQIKMLDFIFVRFFIEVIGCMMAYIFTASILIYFELFPVPADLGALLAGWFLYSYFVMSLCLIIAPLSDISELMEKLLPVSTYIAIPVSGTFNMAGWLAPQAREYILLSPMVTGMELMREGVFGDRVTVYYDVPWTLAVSTVLMLIGLGLCRKVRRTMVVE